MEERNTKKSIINTEEKGTLQQNENNLQGKGKSMKDFQTQRNKRGEWRNNQHGKKIKICGEKSGREITQSV